MAKLEKGDEKTPPIHRKQLDDYLRSHLIDPDILRKDDFEAFMADRQKRLLGLIEKATGKPAYTGDAPEEGVDVSGYDESEEADMIGSLSS